MAGFWKNDQKLEHDLKKYVAANMQRLEIFDFMRKDNSAYKWSLRNLGRRLRSGTYNHCFRRPNFIHTINY